MAWLKLLLVFWLVLALPAPVVAAIGKVVSVQQGAKVTTGGATRTLRQGMEISSGDRITTDGKGVVQLLFIDETKIAVGPNAQMVVDVTMLRGNRRAKNFAVQALGGSFRFISGKSKKSAYSVKTPTATMAVRGTTFDMWIVSDTQSAMVVLEGSVRMCGISGSCRATGRQCSMFATSTKGNVGRPIDEAALQKALVDGFPFIQSQTGLLQPFQADVGGCSERTAIPRPKSDAIERKVERPAPQPVQQTAAPPAQGDPGPPAVTPPDAEGFSSGATSAPAPASTSQTVSAPSNDGGEGVQPTGG